MTPPSRAGPSPPPPRATAALWTLAPRRRGRRCFSCNRPPTSGCSPGWRRCRGSLLVQLAMLPGRASLARDLDRRLRALAARDPLAAAAASGHVDRLGGALGLSRALRAALRLDGAAAGASLAVAARAGGGRGMDGLRADSGAGCSAASPSPALGHTQWRWTTLIQIADAVGAVGVGGVVMAVAAALATAPAASARAAPARRRRGGSPAAAGGARPRPRPGSRSRWHTARGGSRASRSPRVGRSTCCSCRARSTPSSSTIPTRRPTWPGTTTSSRSRASRRPAPTTGPTSSSGRRRCGAGACSTIDPAEALAESVVEEMLGPRRGRRRGRRGRAPGPVPRGARAAAARRAGGLRDAATARTGWWASTGRWSRPACRRASSTTTAALFLDAEGAAAGVLRQDASGDVRRIRAAGRPLSVALPAHAAARRAHGGPRAGRGDDRRASRWRRRSATRRRCPRRCARWCSISPPPAAAPT